MLRQHLLTLARPVKTLVSPTLLALCAASLTITFAELVSNAANAANAAEPEQDEQFVMTGEDSISQSVMELRTRVIGLYNENKYEAALAELQTYLQPGQQAQLNEQENIAIRKMMVSTYMSMDRFEEAMAAEESILQLPNISREHSADALYQLGQFNLVSGNKAKALEYLTRAKDIPGGTRKDVLFSIAWIHQGLQQQEQAIPYMEELIAISGDTPELEHYEVLRGLYLSTNQQAKADSLLQVMEDLFHYQEHLRLRKHLQGSGATQ
jgi:tetratricopeptide (TPR) repeat protein